MNNKDSHSPGESAKRLDRNQDTKKIRRRRCYLNRIAARFKSTIIYAACNGWIFRSLADWIIQEGGFSHV